MKKSLPKLLVIRHGETQWNVAGRLQGRRDTPLTANGVKQALAVASHLLPTVADLPDRAFWVSPLGRAWQTASILADGWRLPFTQFAEEPRIAERSYGIWEGRSLAEVERDLPEQYAAHAADPWEYRMPEGESRTALTQRLRAWVESLDHNRSHVVVTHSGCLRALRGIYSGDAPRDILAYREAQTSAFLLIESDATMLPVPAETLRHFGCEGEARVIEI